MNNVTKMIEHFERLVCENKASPSGSISLSPCNQNQSDEDDELLSYDDDSENDVIDENELKTEPLERQNQSKLTGKDLMQHEKKKNDFDEDGNPLPITSETPTNSFRNNSEDDYNMVYSSDDDTTYPQTSPLIALRSVECIHEDNLDTFPSFTTTMSTNLYEDQRCFDFVNAQGQSPLTIASMNCSAEALKIYIQKGFDVNLIDENGSTPLHYICIHEFSKDQQTCLRLLLENGAFVNVQDHQGRTPLHKAATNNSIANIKLLLYYGACPRIPDNEGNLPLHEVTKTVNIEAIELLSRSNDKCHQKWCTPLRTAPYQEIERIPHDVISEGCEGSKGSEGIKGSQDSQHSDSKEGNGSINPKSMEIWNRFFENAINANDDDNHISLPTKSEQVETKYEYQYPLHSSIYVDDDIGIVKALIESGHDVDQIDEHKNSPLHIAAFRGDLSFVQLLVTAGAKIDCLHNVDNETPLSICISRGYTECANYLMRNCARYSVIVGRSSDDSPETLMNSLLVLLTGYAKFFYNCIRQNLLYGDDEIRKVTSSTTMNVQKVNSVPEDLAIALSKAREKEDSLFFRSMEPPEDLQMALEKAGIINHVKEDNVSY